MYKYKKTMYLSIIVLIIASAKHNTSYAKEKIKDTFTIEEERLNKLLSIKSNNYHINSILTKGMESIQYGDGAFLKTIEYDPLLLFITGLNNIATKEGEHPFYIISRKTPDRIVKRAILGGLKNKDPRIRLFALTTLKQMKLAKDFKTIEKILYITKKKKVPTATLR